MPSRPDGAFPAGSPAKPGMDSLSAHAWDVLEKSSHSGSLTSAAI